MLCCRERSWGWSRNGAAFAGTNLAALELFLKRQGEVAYFQVLSKKSQNRRRTCRGRRFGRQLCRHCNLPGFFDGEQYQSGGTGEFK